MSAQGGARAEGASRAALLPTALSRTLGPWRLKGDSAVSLDSSGEGGWL